MPNGPWFPASGHVSRTLVQRPADNKQSGQHQITGPHPNPLARTDILGYREPYAALNLLSPV
jgi:hypothetical protein